MHSNRGITIIMAVNFCEELIKYADRVIVLKNSALKAYDTPAEIFKNKNLLYDCGIHLPQICEFAHCMEDMGEPLPFFPLTVNEAFDSVLSWYKN